MTATIYHFPVPGEKVIRYRLKDGVTAEELEQQLADLEEEENRPVKDKFDFTWFILGGLLALFI